jgi:3-hydroxybutyryl-CoA dehydratase
LKDLTATGMKIEPGASAELSRTITDADIQVFAEITGDHNPVHLDDDYARQTRFGRRVAHGMLSASLISTVLANQLPGPGTVYLSQSLRFVAPVFPGDTVLVRVTVLSVREDKSIATLETVCLNQRDEKVITGEAVVLFERR